MKKLILLLLVTGSIAFTSFSQAPEGFKYQAVVRDAANVIINNQAVSLRLVIQHFSIGGTAVYTETFSTTTNAYGLVNLQIGTGTSTDDFSVIDWAAGPYFLEIAVDITGGTTYAVMGTSQLMSVPYALFSKTAENVTNDGRNTLNKAYNEGGAGMGRIIAVDAGEIELTNGTLNGIGLRASTTNTGVGIMATSTSTSNLFSPIQASTNATSTLTSAIIGSTTGGASGVSGQVESTATAAQGVYGNNLRTNGGYGTYGIGHSGIAGETNYQLGFGVYGRNYDAIGPLGNAVGTYGLGYIGVWGDQSDPNGYSIYANGDLGAAGTKAFAIDHPLDPENKYLKHYSIESNEVLNLYRGTVPFDTNGEAIVTMPDYFDAVNVNFSYQLTPIGGYAPLFIKEKLKDGKFVIAGGTEGMEVSWTIYAERNDPYLQQHPASKQVEVTKEVWNQGKYLQPDLYNQPDSKKIVKSLETGEATSEKGVEQKSIHLMEE